MTVKGMTCRVGMMIVVRLWAWVFDEKVEEPPAMMEEVDLIRKLERKRSKLVFTGFKLASGYALGAAVRKVRKP